MTAAAIAAVGAGDSMTPNGGAQPPHGYGPPQPGYAQPPQAYAQPQQGYGPPPGPGAGLKVLAVFQILFGLLGLLSPVMTLVTRHAAKDPVSRELDHAMWEGPAALWFDASLVFGVVLAILLLSTGIGLFMGKRWCRTTGIAYGISSIVLMLIGQAVMAVVAYPLLLDKLDAASPVARGAAMGGLIGGLMGSCFGMILPIATLIVLGRKKVLEVLR